MKQTFPNTWHMARLSQMCDLNPRDPIPPDFEGEVSFVPMSAIDEVMGDITEAEPRDIADVRTGYTPFRENDVLFAKITPCMQNGKAAVAKGLIGGRGFGSTEFHVLRAGPHVLPEWLFLYVRNPAFRKRAEAAFTGSAGQQRVPTEFLASAQVPLPPLSEQRRIVGILDEARAIRSLRRQADDLTAKLIPAIFHDMFGDPLSNDRDWPTDVLPKLGTLDRGRSRHRPRDEPSLYDGPYPFIQTGDVRSANGWITRYTQTYSETGLAQSRMWPAGTMCITIAANIAETSIMTFDACFPDSIVGFMPNDRVTVEYVRWTFEVLKAKMEAQAHDGAQKNINLKILNALRLAVPPKSLQDEFARRVDAVREAGLQSRREHAGDPQTPLSDPIDELTNSLLAHAFSGELTAGWREANRELLDGEAAERDAALKAAGVRLVKSARPAIGGDIPTTGRYAELNREQRELLQQIWRAEAEQGFELAFTLESIDEWIEEPLDSLQIDALRRHLDVLVSRGLVRIASRQSVAGAADTPTFGNIYRLPRRQDSDDGGQSDYARMEELTRMARTGRSHRVSVSDSISISGSVDLQPSDREEGN